MFTSLFTCKSMADEKYSFACSNFEVSFIEDDGSFRKVACYEDFSSAKKRMQELGGDHVVRSRTAYSFTKIIAMNSGVVYAYPRRYNKATLNVYQDLYDRSIYTKKTYVSNYRPLYYHDTSLVLKNGAEGMVLVTLNGFKGYCDLEYVDLVPSKFLKRGISIWLGDEKDAYKIIVQYNYFKALKRGSYFDLVFTYHLAYPQKNSLYCEEYDIVVGPAPTFMDEGKLYYSQDGIHYYADSDFSKSVGTNYNYYQWLPLRTKTNIKAASLETYLRNSRTNYLDSKMYQKAQCFIDNQEVYGINALLTFALGVHESNFGLSGYARERNNLFGWKAYDANPDSAMNFSSIDKSIAEHMGINLRGYCDITDGRFFGPSLGNKGAGLNVKYASDPYWGMKIAGIAYEADKASNNYNGKLSDYNKYNLALINEFSTPILANPHEDNSIIYRSEYGPSYQQDFIVTTHGEVGNYTKIQSTNIINDDGSIYTHLTPPAIGEINPPKPYDFERSLAYIETNKLTKLNGINNINNYKISITDFNWQNNLFTIKGNISSENVITFEQNKAKGELLFKGEEYYALNLTLNKDNNSVIFENNFNISDFKVGKYVLSLNVDFGSNSQEIKEKNINYTNLPPVFIINNKMFSFTNEDNKLVLEVSAIKAKQKIISSVKNIKFSDGQLSFNGVGVIKGLSAKNKDDIKYTLVLKNRHNPIEEKLIPIKTTDSSGFSLNDGINYKYGAYVANLSLNDIENGNYSLWLKISYQGLSEVVPLQNSRVESREVTTDYNGRTYHLLANELYNYTLEFDVLASSLPYNEIKKPSARRSLLSYEKLILEDNILNLDAHGLIYYLDYNNLTDVEYKIWAVNVDGKFYEFNVNNCTCSVDFTKALATKNNSSSICFRGSLDMSSIKSGEYYLYVSIRKGTYYDIIPLTNRGLRKTPSLGNFHVLTNENSRQVYLKID